MKQLKVLLYAWDHEGLGHVNRLLAVINGIKEAYDATDFFILAEQESPLLRQAGWPFVCVPSIPHGYRGHVVEDEFPDTSESTELKVGIAQAIVSSLIESFHPDIIIHDTVLWGPLFDAAVAYHIPQVLIIRYRKDMQDYLARIESESQYIDAIILPHEKGEVSANDLPPFIQSKVYFSGPILRIGHTPFDKNTVLTLRQKYNIVPDVPTIIITGGGGGYTANQLFFETVAEALAQAISSPILCIVVLGCFYMGTLTLPKSPHVIWVTVGFENHLPALMSLADLVITQVGYNTINELQAVRTPSLLVPGNRPFDDQARRAYHFATVADNMFVVEPFTLNHMQDMLRTLLPTFLRQPRSQPDLSNFLGYRRCADIILQLLNISRSPTKSN